MENTKKPFSLALKSSEPVNPKLCAYVKSALKKYDFLYDFENKPYFFSFSQTHGLLQLNAISSQNVV